MHCAIYTRVSTDTQADIEFNSCKAQEEKIRAFVKSQNNWNIIKVYSDPGYSGANLNRPALQSLLEDIKHGGIDIVLTYKIDRLTRSPKDFYQLIEIFDKYKINFISVTERFDTSTPAGRLLRNIMLTFAQFERELVSERTRDKLLERAKKGLWNGGLVPFGYKRENKKLIINSKESEIVKLMYETYIETGSLSQVYRTLKEKNIKDRKGKSFSQGAISYILRNMIYTGKVKYAGAIYQGIHKAIISEEVFKLTQQIHKKKIMKLRLYKDFLFGGLVDCKECGSKMTSCYTNKRKGNRLKRYYYYRCTSTLKRDWNICSTKQVNANRLENYVLESLDRISHDKNYIDNLIFRLNHEVEAGGRSGYELSKEWSPYSSNTLQSILKFFLCSLAQTCPRRKKSFYGKKGVERDLLIKRFIKNIVYSKDEIRLNLYYSKHFDVSQNASLRSVNASKNVQNKKGDFGFQPEIPQFESLDSTPRAGLEPATCWLTASRSAN